MRTVLLVDDDLPMLSRLKTMIDWEAHGYAICGEATGGKAAARLALERKPEIVVTDMSMPGMDGLALIALLQEQLPDAKIIAVSGYSDVHYIRNSMKGGAIDYILKHELTGEVLLQTLRAASAQLDERRRERRKSRDLQKQLELSRSFLAGNAIRRLVQGDGASERETLDALERLGVTFYRSNITVVVAGWDRFGLLQMSREPKELAELAQSFMDIAGHIVAETDKAYAAQVEEGKFALLFSFPNTSGLYWHSVIHETLGRIRVSLKRLLNLSASCSVGPICTSLAQVPEGYRAADRSLSERFYEGNDVVIWPDSLKKEPPQSDAVKVDMKLEKDLLLRLSRLDEEGVILLLHDLFGRMTAARASSKTAQLVGVDLLHLANKLIKETGTDAARVFAGESNPYQTLLRFDTIAEMGEWFAQLHRRLLRELRDNQLEQGCSVPVRQTLEWIRRRYAEPVTLQMAADEVGVNASYLSRLFKEEVGQGFADYLSRYRIEQAKRLLRSGETDLKEIARLVGYGSYNYFFTVFKKLTGLTPLEYEKGDAE